MGYQLGVAYHPAFLLHDPGPDHPERSERVSSIMKEIDGAPWNGLVQQIKPRQATIDELAYVHSKNYIDSMRKLCESGGEFLPAMSAAVGEESFPAALYAVGAGFTLADEILKGSWKLGFAPVRPPGHHAIHSRPWGFCIFNNVSILAHYLLNNCNLDRVGIFDFDIHHGNGTEQTFWKDPRVLYCSIHREDHFPSNTGHWYDKGEAEGEGFTVNIPVNSNIDNQQYLNAIDRYALPVFQNFKPQIILVSAGFDGHWRDIIGGMQLTSDVFTGIGERVNQLASDEASGKVITILEGGYDLIGNAEGVLGYLGSLLGYQNTNG